MRLIEVPFSLHNTETPSNLIKLEFLVQHAQKEYRTSED